LFLALSARPRVLHPFPTRRSSDLAQSSGRRAVAAKRPPDDIDRRLINALQGEFPLTETPFADIGAVLGLAEAEVIARLQSLLDEDRKSTRLNSSHVKISYAVFCLK